MPSLIRLIVALLFLAGLGYAGLTALAFMVVPGEKEITIRVPARDLVTAPANPPLITPEAPPAEPEAFPAPNAPQVEADTSP